MGMGWKWDGNGMGMGMGDEKHRYGEFLWVVKKCWSSVEVVGGRGMVWMNSVPFYFILFSKKKEKKRKKKVGTIIISRRTI